MLPLPQTQLIDSSAPVEVTVSCIVFTVMMFYFPSGADCGSRTQLSQNTSSYLIIPGLSIDICVSVL
ncbi:unnamed protein product [Amoebophrya sp. A25]|nr:unnamed protein product [Amoebophrya sp. A25]|eukprot:GSA25T00005094001.1